MYQIIELVVTVLPLVVLWGGFAAALVRYALRARPEYRDRFRIAQFTFKQMSAAVAAFYCGYAALLTALQYLTWSSGTLSRTLLTLPLSPDLPAAVVQRMSWLLNSSFGYFIFYSSVRFWFGIAITVGVAWLWWQFLRILQRRNTRFFEDEEPELGFLVALLVGWPKFVVFFPLVFVAVVAVSVFRAAFLKRRLTTLGWPFLVAGFLTLVLGTQLLAAAGLAVLNV